MIGSFQDQTREEEISVGETSQMIAIYRTAGQRKVLVVRNTSEDQTVISIAFGDKQAQNGKGIILKQNESFTDASSEGYQAFNGAVNAIASSANGKISIFER